MAKKKIDYASMFTLRKNGTYEAKYTDATGRHSLYSKDPEKLYYKLQEKLNAVPRIPTFREIALQWWVEHVEKLEESTQATYKAPFEKVVAISGAFAVDTITAAEIDRVLKSEKAAGMSYKHAASVKSMYKQILDFAIVKGHIVYNPTAALTVPRGMKRGKRKSPEDDMIKVIEANLDKPFGNFVALLLYTGLRTQEAAALRWSDIDLKNEMIDISRAVMLRGTPKLKDTKTDAGTREVPILPPLLPFLQRPEAAAADDYIFNSGGKLLTRGQINSRWLNWCKDAGLAEQKLYEGRHRGETECTRTEWRPLLTPHQLRHYYATLCVEANLDEMVTKRLLGHTDINFTKAIYAEVRKKFQADEINKLKRIYSTGSNDT